MSQLIWAEATEEDSKPIPEAKAKLDDKKSWMYEQHREEKGRGMLIPKLIKSPKADMTWSSGEGGGQRGGLPRFFWVDLTGVEAKSTGAICASVPLTGYVVCRGRSSRIRGYSSCLEATRVNGSCLGVFLDGPPLRGKYLYKFPTLWHLLHLNGTPS